MHSIPCLVTVDIKGIESADRDDAKINEGVDGVIGCLSGILISEHESVFHLGELFTEEVDAELEEGSQFLSVELSDDRVDAELVVHVSDVLYPVGSMLGGSHYSLH